MEKLHENQDGPAGLDRRRGPGTNLALDRHGHRRVLVLGPRQRRCACPIHGTVGRPAISVPVSKSSRARAIPLDDRAIELLDEAKSLWGTDGYMFSQGTFGKGNLRRDTVAACKKAKVRQIDFHGLRRSCGARWLECGVPLFYVSRMLGHADVSTTAKHYAGLADTTLAAEIEKVNATNCRVVA
ncbi:MAG: tyrosine-type recombinase/integrase [Candidatus Uhrbacteria bacterium]|nr:tyrosine-type recombinase/integrase [Candidatus Uhrbacteria bacterium]